MHIVLAMAVQVQGQGHEQKTQAHGRMRSQLKAVERWTYMLPGLHKHVLKKAAETTRVGAGREGMALMSQIGGHAGASGNGGGGRAGGNADRGQTSTPAENAVDQAGGLGADVREQKRYTIEVLCMKKENSPK